MHTVITPDQSRSARRELGISQADVASALSLNRQYLSEFENGHTSRLTSNQLRKLRSFYEEKISEAKAHGEEIELEFGESQQSDKPFAELETFTAKRFTLSVADEVPIDVMGKALDSVQQNDARLAVLLEQQVSRDEGLLGSGEFSEETVEALQEVFALLSLNYVLYRMLSGWPALKLAASSEAPQTLRDVIFDTYRERLEAVGLVNAETAEVNDEN
jgi:transcriptional regulator with XRE-family HTH domain